MKNSRRELQSMINGKASKRSRVAIDSALFSASPFMSVLDRGHKMGRVCDPAPTRIQSEPLVSLTNQLKDYSGQNLFQKKVRSPAGAVPSITQ
jgi:hypothetical protein